MQLPEELTTKSATELAAMIRARAVSPVEVVEAHLARIERINPALNAIVTLATDAIEQAQAAEAAIMNGSATGPLHGVPLTVKDTIETAGMRTTIGSLLRRDHVPERDATVVARLKAAGAIILGKTNTPEMAIPYETDNLIFGRTNNPHDLERTPGGSSGGEAAAIAAGLSPAGIASDLSGSIRVPAHFCGIAGLKPTSGRVPMDGHVPVAAGSLALGAAIGPLARCVEDLSLIFSVIADPTQFELNATDNAWLGKRLAWYTDDGVAPVDAETSEAVESAAKALGDAGLEVTQAMPPGVGHGSRLWIELFARAAADQTRAMYQDREAEAGPQVAALLRRLDEKPLSIEDKISAAERLASAVIERERLREDLLSWMKTTPLILAPVGATAAFRHGASRLDVGDNSISVFRAFSYSQTFNVFGLPVAVVPVRRSADGMPIGVQIVGAPFAEQLVLAVAAILEKAFGGWQKPSQVFV